jgi:hypothetical protein
MLSLYEVHDVPETASWIDALRHCGLDPVASDRPAASAINGALMPLPLTSAQCQQAEQAWEEYRRLHAA